MKIGIDISQIVYTGTGVATYTQNLVQSLVETAPGHEYTLLGTSLRRQAKLWKFMQQLPHRGSVVAKIYSLPPTITELLWDKLHVLNIENLIGQVDVFHTSDWTEPPAKTRKITTIHDLVVFKYPRFLNRHIIDTQMQKLHWVKKESKAIIADSESTKRDIIEYLKYPENKIHVVYLGVGKQYFPRSHDEISRVKKKYGLPDTYILTVGTREPRKNLTSVMKAFQAVRIPHIQLVVVGKFGWGEEIEIVPQALLLDLVPVSDLPALYSGASSFVYPSLYEGFGLPVLEAMGCGCPVVTSDRGSLVEIAKNTAVTVDPESPSQIAEAVKSVLELSGTKRQSLIQKGIAHAREFTWKKTAQKTLKVYQSVI